MYLVYLFSFLGVVLIFSTIPNSKNRLKKTINKYLDRKNTWENLLIRLESSSFTKFFIPKLGTEKYEKEETKLRKSGIKLSLERMFTIRVSVSVLMFALSLALYINMNFLREQGVFADINNSNNAASVMFGNKTTKTSQSDVIYQSLLKYSLEQITDYRKYFKDNDLESIYKRVIDVREKIGIEDPNDQAAKKVVFTLKKGYEVSRITVKGILLLLLISLFSSILVDMAIKIMSNIRTRKIEKEFEKIEAVTILLLNKEQINVISLLQQMKRQAKILKPALQQCLNEYTSNPYKALDNLINEVNNTDFTKFMTVIKQCLSSDKDTNTQILKIQRGLRLAMQESINKQRNKGKSLKLTILQFPLIFLLILLVMLPFLDIIKSSI